jgi:hypothetical protein
MLSPQGFSDLGVTVEKGRIGFRVRRLRPLGHLSGKDFTTFLSPPPEREPESLPNHCQISVDSHPECHGNSECAPECYRRLLAREHSADHGRIATSHCVCVRINCEIRTGRSGSDQKTALASFPHAALRIGSILVSMSGETVLLQMLDEMGMTPLFRLVHVSLIWLHSPV